MSTTNEFLSYYLAKIGRTLSAGESIVQTSHTARWKTTEGWSFMVSPWLRDAGFQPIIEEMDEAVFVGITADHSAELISSSIYFGLIGSRHTFAVVDGDAYLGFKMPAGTTRIVGDKSVGYYGVGWSVQIVVQWNETTVKVLGPAVLELVGTATFDSRNNYVVSGGRIVGFNVPATVPTFLEPETNFSIWSGDIYGESPLSVVQVDLNSPRAQIYAPKTWETGSDKNAFLVWENPIGVLGHQIPPGANIIEASLIVQASASGEVLEIRSAEDAFIMSGQANPYPEMLISASGENFGSTWTRMLDSEVLASGEYVYSLGPSGEYLTTSSVSGELEIGQVIQFNGDEEPYLVQGVTGNTITLDTWTGDLGSGNFVSSSHGLLAWPTQGELLDSRTINSLGTGELPLVEDDLYVFDITDTITDAVENYSNRIVLELSASGEVTGTGVVDPIYQSDVPASVIVLYDMASSESSPSGTPELMTEPTAAEDNYIYFSARLLDTRNEPLVGYPVLAYLSTESDVSTFSPSGEFPCQLYDPASGIKGNYIRPATGKDGTIRLAVIPPSAASIGITGQTWSEIVATREVQQEFGYDLDLNPQPDVMVSASGELTDLIEFAPLPTSVHLYSEPTHFGEYPRFVFHNPERGIYHGVPKPGTVRVYGETELTEYYPPSRSSYRIPLNQFTVNYPEGIIQVNADLTEIDVEYDAYPFWVDPEDRRTLHLHTVTPEPKHGVSMTSTVDLYPDVVLYLYLEYRDPLNSGRVLRVKSDVVMLSPLSKIKQMITHSRG